MDQKSFSSLDEPIIPSTKFGGVVNGMFIMGIACLPCPAGFLNNRGFPEIMTGWDE
jgi:hypothetical protein